MLRRTEGSKSIGAETSFAVNLSDRPAVLHELEQIALSCHQRLEQNSTRGRTLTLKIKFSDYQQITRSKTMPDYTRSLDIIIATATALFEAVEWLCCMKEKKDILFLGWSSN
ncbi:MAG: hypothetical protein RMY28_006705 [Nostoc sp. ChiSLP01]|nr:hypothetical protein [Nostoc sp. CmiSLP01]MDZ8282117.1 hypothetical protein [Nostoc sp. ChiSLP01]